MRASPPSASSGSAATAAAASRLVAASPASRLELGEQRLGLGEPAEAEAGERVRELDRSLADMRGFVQSISRLLFSSKGVTCERYSCHSRRLLSST